MRACAPRCTGFPAMSKCLHVDRASIGVATAAALLVDVARFEELARAEDLDSLETATTLPRRAPEGFRAGCHARI